MKIEYLQMGGVGALIKNLLKLLIFGMAHLFKNIQLADIKKGFEHAGNLKYVNYLLVLFLLMPC